MAHVEAYEREIEHRTYGKDIRMPIRDALLILNNAIGLVIESPKVLLTQGAYDAIEEYDPIAVYCIIFEEGEV